MADEDQIRELGEKIEELTRENMRLQDQCMMKQDYIAGLERENKRLYSVQRTAGIDDDTEILNTAVGRDGFCEREILWDAEITVFGQRVLIPAGTKLRWRRSIATEQIAKRSALNAPTVAE